MHRTSDNNAGEPASRRNVGRRQILQGLGAATAIALLPGNASVLTAAAQTSAGRAGAFPAPTNINHLSCAVTDYARTRDFYVDLFGMRVTWDNGKRSLNHDRGGADGSFRARCRPPGAVGGVAGEGGPAECLVVRLPSRLRSADGAARPSARAPRAAPSRHRERA
jgi:hypothetical protein